MYILIPFITFTDNSYVNPLPSSMKKIILLATLIFISFPHVFAQYYTAQNKQWAFGHSAGLDFTSGSPSAIGTSMNTNEGCASVADGSGNMLFYTEGTKVWDRTGAIMPSGSAIVSYVTQSSSQGALIAPVLGTTTQYYVFSLENIGGTSGYCHLDYCIVDMSLHGGLGDVVASTIGTVITNNLAEKMMIVAGNNCDLWLVTHKLDSAVFLSYNITSSGIAAPVVSYSGAYTSSLAYAIGMIKISPDRQHLVCQIYTSAKGTELHDFNPSTGVVSNCRKLDSLSVEYGAEFSPNSNLLYCQYWSTRIDQYDITAGGGSAAAIRATKTTVVSSYTVSDLKLAPDGKIYLNPSYGSTTLSCIPSPNTSGTGCGYSTGAATLASGSSGTLGLPNVYVAPIGGDTVIKRIDTSLCIGPVGFNIGADTTGSSYLWNTGATTDTITVTAIGTYWVIIANGCSVHIDTFHVTSPTPILTNHIHDTSVCNTFFPITLTATAGFATDNWYDGAAGITHSVPAAGTYWVWAADTCNNVTADTFHVIYVIPDTTVGVVNTLIPCIFTAPITLTATGGFASYRWNTGAVTSTISVAVSGTYRVFKTNGCSVKVDTFHVNFTAPDTTVGITTSYSPCIVTAPLTLNAVGAFTSYKWSTGATTPSINVLTSGTYWVFKIINCSVVVDTFHVNFITVPVLNLGPDVAFCIGDSIILSSSQPAGTIFTWSTGSSADSIHVASSGTYWLRLFNGCTITDSIHILVSPYPLVDLGPDTFNCLGAPVTLQSLYTYSVPTYLWSDGSTAASDVVTVTGDYWLKVTVAGCASEDTIHVTILYDTFTLLNRDTAICKGRVVQAVLWANPMATFQWLPTAGIGVSNVASPLIAPDTTAMYVVNIYMPGCPVKQDSFLIDVQPNPDVYIGGNRFVCLYDTIHINSSVKPAWFSGYTYSWAPAASLDFTNTPTVVFTAGASQQYILTVTTSAGCIGLDSAQIIVQPGNFGTITPNFSVCPHDSALLTGTGGGTYHWYPSLYLSDSVSATPWVKPIGTINYKLIVTSTVGCHDTLHVNVSVLPGALLSLDDSIILYPGESVQLSPITNCNSFVWFPPAGLSDAHISNPVASPEVSTKYLVYGVTTDGCTATDSININPESLITLPNAFTPGTGINNKFYVIKRGTAVLNSFRIFNRWGEVVFETRDVNEGWDGMYKGAPQPLGVYVYDVQAVTNTGVLFNKHGNVTLLR